MTGYWDTDKDDKEALLEASWKAGHSGTEIAAALRERFGGAVSRAAVLGKVARLGLPLHQSHAAAGISPNRRRKA